MSLVQRTLSPVKTNTRRRVGAAAVVLQAPWRYPALPPAVNEDHFDVWVFARVCVLASVLHYTRFEHIVTGDEKRSTDGGGGGGAGAGAVVVVCGGGGGELYLGSCCCGCGGAGHGGVNALVT